MLFKPRANSNTCDSSIEFIWMFLKFAALIVFVVNVLELVTSKEFSYLMTLNFVWLIYFEIMHFLFGTINVILYLTRYIWFFSGLAFFIREPGFTSTLFGGVHFSWGKNLIRINALHDNWSLKAYLLQVVIFSCCESYHIMNHITSSNFVNCGIWD